MTNSSRSTCGLSRILVALWVSACAGADSVTVSNGGEPGSLQVVVTDDLNHGVPGIKLTLVQTGQSPMNGTSRGDGTFVFARVAAGSWTLLVEPGEGFQLGPGELVSRPVSVPSNGTATQRIHVVAGGRSVIAGQVMYGGSGVGHVQIALHGVGGRDLHFTTEDDGRFHLDGLQEGSWILDVSPPSYFTMAAGQQASRAVAVGGNDSVSMNVQLARPGGPITVEISLLMSSYDPDDVVVPPGAKIRWTNIFEKAHTISPGGHWAWRVVEMSRPGEQFEVVLNNPGIYSYLCEYLYAGGMTAYITVKP